MTVNEEEKGERSSLRAKVAAGAGALVGTVLVGAGTASAGIGADAADAIGDMQTEAALATAGALAAGLAMWTVPQVIHFAKRVYHAARR
jgi:hypothetical protein